MAITLLAGAVPAHAGTFKGKMYSRDGTPFGVMKYHASPGVANRVTVGPYVEGQDASYIFVRDRAERVRAGGDCIQVDRHTAKCPWTESDSSVRVFTGNRDDRVAVVQGCRTVRPRLYCRHFSGFARGGSGRDVLTGGGELYGDSGNDVLRGTKAKYSWDRLHGGPGRDRMEGRGAARDGLTDVFFDDETDAQAARDVVIAGKKARARIDYSMRKRSMKIDLHKSRMGPERDIVSDVKSVNTGAGNDVLIGTGGPNELGGGPGRDRLYGMRGDDRIGGGGGDDAMYGGHGDDTLSEPGYFYLARGPQEGGRDLFVGGPGADEMRALGLRPKTTTESDDVRCDARDKPVLSDPSDRLRGCALMAGWDIAMLEMRTRPQLTADGAAFTLRCAPTEMEPVNDANGNTSGYIQRCRGELVVRSTGGTEYGRQAFSFEMEDYRTPWVTVTVPLSPLGRQAIGDGDVIEVEAVAHSTSGWQFDPAGYRSVLASR